MAVIFAMLAVFAVFVMMTAMVAPMIVIAPVAAAVISATMAPMFPRCPDQRTCPGTQQRTFQRISHDGARQCADPSTDRGTAQDAATRMAIAAGKPEDEKCRDGDGCRFHDSLRL